LADALYSAPGPWSPLSGWYGAAVVISASVLSFSGFFSGWNGALT
jgi:hypothetical protein